MAESIQNNSTEYDYSNVEVDSFWLEEVSSEKIVDERCLKVIGVLQQSITRGCNFPDEFAFRSEPWNAREDLLQNIFAAIPNVLITLILSILVGISYWIVSYAIYRLIRVCLKKTYRRQALKESSQKSEIALISFQIVEERNNFSPKKMFLSKLEMKQKKEILSSNLKLNNNDNSTPTLQM